MSMSLTALRSRIASWWILRFQLTRETIRAWTSQKLVDLVLETRENAPTAIHIGDGESVRLYWLTDAYGNAVVVAESDDAMLMIPSEQALEVARLLAQCAAEADREADQ